MKLPISVMIPAYNAWDTLPRAINSVPWELVEQVAVVLDGEAWPLPRIQTPPGVEWRHFEENIGATGAYNRCLLLARAPLVHILHADDTASLHFYVTIAAMAEAWPGCALYGSWYFYGLGDKLAMPMPAPKQWLAPSTDTEPLWYANPIAASGVVVRRSFYERAGGFDQSLVHVADWEMWLRAIGRGLGVFTPAPLVTYHQSDAQHTSRLAKTADNLRDWLRMLPFLEERRGFERERFVARVLAAAVNQAARFRANGDEDAARANNALAKELEE